MYNFFLDGVQFPIAPSEMNTRINNQNETIVLMNEGEVNVLKKPGLTDIEFEVLLPNVKHPFSTYPDGFQPATHYLEKLEQLKVGQEPFQFIVNRMMPSGDLLFDTNMSVSLEDYEIQEDAENGFDIVVAINLKQDRPYGTKRLKIETSTSNGGATRKATVEKQRPATSKKIPKSVTVKSGDTLWAIAKLELGDGSKYTELAKINNIANPNAIKVGQVIKLE
ncbi:muramidase-2 [Bacillus sp. OxB-1]|uniref:LysM peptidoglycan-binding domain-containing protein n=1 Tax=Bacillus sp. (strain OxB-1) TaxID=98228 RepID=UPI000582077B|nr:LysM domain-containing protein [Bacillus sp. OxB-1]BAQ11297.1 muramidase-2 [Bacillus sp. OxB-1]